VINLEHTVCAPESKLIGLIVIRYGYRNITRVAKRLTDITEHNREKQTEAED